MSGRPCRAAAAADDSPLGRRLGGLRPRLLLTLGSGLGVLADDVADPTVIGYDQVGLPGTTVAGHAGRLVAGTLHGLPVLVQQGRVHLYEGASPDQVAACVGAAAAVGVDTFLVTNAAGGIAPHLRGGDLLVLSDHLNLTGSSPLVGRDGPPRFLDLSDAYDPGLRRLAHSAAAETGQRLTEAVYAGVVGPAYETPAEVRMLRTLGADAVGMSTVVEVIAARALGLRVLGLSLVANVHAPDAPPADHATVLEAARGGAAGLGALLRALLPRLAGGGSPAAH